jgi:molecular chaperone GrpE
MAVFLPAKHGIINFKVKNIKFCEAMVKKSATEKKGKEQDKAPVNEAEVKDQEQQGTHKNNGKPQEDTESKEEAQEGTSEAEAAECKTPEKELEEYKDRYLRLSAEFDNYRKRTLKEKIEMTKTASEDIIKKLLPVLDDFQRGLASMETAKDVEAVKEGVKLIYNKLNDLLKQQGVKEIEAMEKEFDMEIHEAITKIPAPKDELKGKVVDVVEKGYYLNEKNN